MRLPFYSLNERYFNTVMEPSQAYILGFIWADGSVRENSGLRLVIQQRDISVLEYIRQELNSNVPIKIREIRGMKYADFSVNRKAMTSDLYRLGMTANKSQNNARIPNIPEKLLPSFIRGFFDGDGSIWQKGKHFVCGFTGGYSFLVWIAELLENSGIRTNPVRFRYGTDNKNSCSLELTAPAMVQKLFNYMNQSPFSLSRKTQKFINASLRHNDWLKTRFASNGSNEQIWKLYQQGLTQKRISEQLRLPYSSVRGAVQRIRKTYGYENRNEKSTNTTKKDWAGRGTRHAVPGSPALTLRRR